MLQAIVSDLHSNIEALTEVLADIESQKADEIVCLGDVIGYGPNPREVLEIARTRFRFVLKGNHEEAVLFRAVGFNEKAMEAVNWTREQLSDRSQSKEVNSQIWNFLGGLEPVRVEGDVMYVHASPLDPTTQYLLPGDAFNRALMEEVFEQVPHIGFGGHTHIPGVFIRGGQFHSPKDLGETYTVTAGKAFINVGSVGQPRDGDPRCSYALWDGKTIRWRRLNYDYKTTYKKIKATKRLPEVLGTRLALGR